MSDIPEKMPTGSRASHVDVDVDGYAPICEVSTVHPDAFWVAQNKRLDRIKSSPEVQNTSSVPGKITHPSLGKIAANDFGAMATYPRCQPCPSWTHLSKIA